MRRLPYVFVLAGALVFFFYPRFLPATAPAVMHSDGIVGFAYGIAIGLQIVGLIMLRNGGRRIAC